MDKYVYESTWYGALNYNKKCDGNIKDAEMCEKGIGVEENTAKNNLHY